MRHVSPAVRRISRESEMMRAFFHTYRKTGLFALAGIIVLSFAVISGCSATERKSDTASSSGGSTNGSSGKAAAPDFTMQTLDGGSVSLSDYAGKPIVVNFAASWCGPCEYEAPVLAKAYDDYKDQVVFLGVAVKDNIDSQRAFAERHGLRFPIGMDPSGNISYSYQKAGNVSISAIPMTFFVDSKGKIATYWVGPLTDENIEMMIQAIL